MLLLVREVTTQAVHAIWPCMIPTLLVTTQLHAPAAITACLLKLLWLVLCLLLWLLE